MFAERTRWDRRENALAERLRLRRRVGSPILDLTESNPTRCGFDYGDPSILGALENAASLDYDPAPRGMLAAREAVSRSYQQRGVAVPPDSIVLTTGTSEAYSFAFRLLADAGDSILFPAPSYPLFDLLARLNDVKLTPYPLLYDHGWRIDFHALDAAITPRCRAIMVVTPNNPTGSFVGGGDLQRLVDLARRRKLAVIADEVFCDYPWTDPPARPKSFAEIDSCLTITLNGLSKSAALPQMKLAWMAVNGPPEQAREALARLEIIADTYLSVSTPIQLAAEHWIAGGGGVRAQVLARVRDNLAHLDARLARGLLCSRLRGEGGWYAVLRVPATRSDEQWAIELLEADGVYLHPGEWFHFPSPGHLVISLLPEPRVFGEGVDRLVRRVDATA